MFAYYDHHGWGGSSLNPGGRDAFALTSMSRIAQIVRECVLRL
jgi:hypothetical protein